MKDIEMHKFLGKVSRELERIREQIKDNSISEEIYNLKREVLKQMIKIEKEVWKEERKRYAKNM